MNMNSEFLVQQGYTPLEEITNRRGVISARVQDHKGAFWLAKYTLEPDSGEGLSPRLALRNEARIMEMLAGRVGPALGKFRERDESVLLALSWITGTRAWDYIDVLRPGGLRKMLAAFMTICREVEKLHATGIVHGDLQPAHFLFDGSGEEVTLLDFGMSKEPYGTDFPAEGGMVHFTSPEVARKLLEGSTEPVLDYVAEVYSLCAVLWFLYAGQVPVKYSEEATYEEKLGCVSSGFLNLDAANLEFRCRDLELALRKGLETNPNRRLASVSELLSLLITARTQ
jgi:serine/threonine protein kinase